MPNQTESETSVKSEAPANNPVNLVKMGLFAAASALAVGLAAAWWYRNTLKTLRQTEEIDPNPTFGISPDDTDYDI